MNTDEHRWEIEPIARIRFHHSVIRQRLEAGIKTSFLSSKIRVHPRLSVV
jgi:hypothetical protein